MKIFRFTLFLMIPLFLFSCKKDDGPYIKIKTIENLIYEAIRDYRIEQGETGPFVHQYFVVGEAQIYSYKMANGVVEVNTDGLDVHWDNLLEKYSFYNLNALVLKDASGNEDVILDELLQLPEGEATLLQDVTQCGVGVETDSEGYYYITVLLAKADS